MAKKKEVRAAGKQQKSSLECDLDNGYQIPVNSFKDLTFENIQSVPASSGTRRP